MKLGFNENRRGDIESIIFAVVMVFIIGVLFLFSNRLVDEIYTELDEWLNTSSLNLNDSVARSALQDIHDVENSVWDFAFLFIALGLFLVLGLSAFSTRISPIFYWIYGVISLLVLMLGVILANTWQTIAQTPAFATTIVRFPITNAILGTYYPTFVTGIIIVAMIFLFGKPPGANAQ